MNMLTSSRTFQKVSFLRVFQKMRVWVNKQLENFSETGIGWYTY